jgi:hypothetical protein
MRDGRRTIASKYGNKNFTGALPCIDIGQFEQRAYT